MKKQRAVILLVLLMIIFVSGCKKNEQPLDDSEVINQDVIDQELIKQEEKKEQICLIINSTLKSSRVDEFFLHLSLEEDKMSVNVYYVDTYQDIDDNAEAIEDISNANQVIVIGIPSKTEHNHNRENWLKFVELDKFKALGKADAKWYYVAALDSIDSTDWSNLIVNYGQTYNTVSGEYPWYCFTHNGRFDSIIDLGIKGESIKPTWLAGYGLGVYLQYKVYGNHCTNQTYSDIITEMEVSDDTMENRSNDIEEARKLITGEITIIDDTNMINVIDATEEKLSSQNAEFIEKHYDVFDTMYVGEEGIWGLEKDENGNPIISTGANGDYTKSDTEMMFFEGTWEEDHWEEKTYRDAMDLSKVVFTYLDYNMKKDLLGNWYASAVDKEDEKLYLCAFDQNRNFIKKICLSDTVSTYVSDDFYVVNKNQIIIPTYSYYGWIMNQDKDLEYNNRYIDGITLIDLETEQIIRKYDVGFPIHDIKVSDGKILGLDYTNEWLVIINQESGEVEKSIFIGNLGFVKEETDERTWSDIRNFYDIYEDTVYFMKKSGIYTININDGKCSRILEGGNLEFFRNPDMYATDFLVKDNREMYILAVYIDEECATDFYQYKLSD